MASGTCDRAKATSTSCMETERGVCTRPNSVARPKTVPTPTGRDMEQSKLRTQEGAARRQLHFHSKLKKYSRTASPGSRTASPGSKQYSVSPGYTLSRSSNYVHMNINSDVFFGSTASAKPPTMHESPSIKHEQLITPIPKQVSEEGIKIQAALQKELSELSFQLEQQKALCQKITKELEDKYENEKVLIKEQYECNLSTIRSAHHSEVQALQASHVTELEDKIKVEATFRDSLTDEVDFLRELLENTKTELRSEADRRVKDTEAILMRVHNEELKKIENQFSAAVEQQVMKLKMELEGEQAKRIECLQMQHKQEIKDMLEQFSDVKDMTVKLSKAIQSNARLEQEVAELKEALSLSLTQQLHSEKQLEETQKKLSNLQLTFSQRVHETEMNYRDRVDSLTRENSDLRKHALQTSMEYGEYRANVHRIQKPIPPISITDRMRAVVKARSTAKLGVAVGLNEKENISTPQSRSRPLSAPETSEEQKLARERSTEHNLQELRPLSCIPFTRH